MDLYDTSKSDMELTELRQSTSTQKGFPIWLVYYEGEKGPIFKPFFTIQARDKYVESLPIYYKYNIELIFVDDVSNVSYHV